MRTIALEEHFASRMFLDTIGMHVAGAGDIPTDQLADLGERRLREMDAGGIDMQVLGHTHFGDAKLDVEQQRVITVAANDQAAAAVAAHPDRFAAFAALPMSDPEAAVRELTRAVEELGFAGAMINGLTDGRFLDDPALFSVLDRAARLRVPIYLHPGFPPEAVVREYYSTTVVRCLRMPHLPCPRQPGDGIPRPGCMCCE